MPVGNIDPRTDVLTLTSMKLGNEEYPSTVQQAESENTGYLLYAPRLLASAVHITGTVAYHYPAFFRAGNYDIFGSAITISADYWVVIIDGTTLMEGSNSDGGTITSMNIPSDGFYDISVNGTNVSEFSWTAYARQYA